MAEEPIIAPQLAWHVMTQEEVFSELDLGKDALKSGLTEDDAAERLIKYGENKLAEKEKVTIWQRIWEQVANVLVGILVFVAVVSAIRAITSTDGDTIFTNWIQVGIIVSVITYVYLMYYLLLVQLIIVVYEAITAFP